jgi:hypothetical protein
MQALRLGITKFVREWGCSDAVLEHVTWSQLKHSFRTRKCGVKELLKFGLELHHQHTSYITSQAFGSRPRAGQCVMAACRLLPVSQRLAY